MIIGITINNILRDHLSKLSEAYEFITEQKPIEPINPFNLTPSFPTIEPEVNESEFTLDLNGSDDLAYNEDDKSFEVYNFIYNDAAFEVFGRCEETEPNILSKLLKFSKENEVEIVLLNRESSRSKCATLFYLSKNQFDFGKIIFPDDWKSFWKHCDVLVTDNPEILKIKRRKKILIKVNNEFNLDYNADFSIFKISDLFDIIDDVKAKIKK